MPELPEVETTRRGILPHVKNRTVAKLIVRQPKLRWPIPHTLKQQLEGQTVTDVSRRGKYLLLATEAGTLLIHLGMSGSLRIIAQEVPAAKHDHVDIILDTGKALRYTDPRRFGSILWQVGDVREHKLLKALGPEPLDEAFDADYLFRQSRSRKVPIKTFIMDSHIVVGVGNIYANEALYMAGINPCRGASNIAKARYAVLVSCIKRVLRKAIEVGGTTLKDFTNSDGEPGYFKQELKVYGRGGLPCEACAKPLKEVRLGARSTVYCTACQS